MNASPPLEVVRGQSVAPLFTEEDRAAGLLPRELALARAQGSAGGECWMLRADGRSLRAECAVTPLYSDAGEHTGYSKIVRDVTTAYQASQALRQAKEDAKRANELMDQFLAVLSHRPTGRPASPPASRPTWRCPSRCTSWPTRCARRWRPAARRHGDCQAKAANP